MIDILTVKWFYPLLFTTITIIAVVLILAIKSVLEKYKYSDEHIDTTDKFSKAHTEVVEAKFTPAHEHEIHTIENKLRSIEKQMQEISAMLTDITNRVIALEKKK